MNTLINDFGKTVIAVGAPGSIERVKCQYPKVINQIYTLMDISYITGNSQAEGIMSLLLLSGIDSFLELDSILTVVTTLKTTIPITFFFAEIQIIKKLFSSKLSRSHNNQD